MSKINGWHQTTDPEDLVNTKVNTKSGHSHISHSNCQKAKTKQILKESRGKKSIKQQG